MKAGAREWTEAEAQQLKKMRRDGMSYPAIARAMNRTTSSVEGKGNNLGLGTEFRELGARAYRDTQALIPRVDRSKMSMTALMLGDPPPGRSALDQGASA